MGSMTTRFVIVGDIHGRFESLAEGLGEVRHRWGQLDFVLAVGDLEANRDRSDQVGVAVPARYRKMGDFPGLVAGEIVLGAPLYFIAGNHDPYPMLDRAGPGEWTPGVWWLGRFGITRIGDVTVGFLSGIYSPKYSELAEPSRQGPKQRTYWHRSELHQLIDTVGRLDGRLDVLLTHDWPSGVLADRRGNPIGDPSLRELVETVQPRVHACGHRHYDQKGMIGSAQVVCLAKPHAGPRGLQGIAVVERSQDGDLEVLT